MFYNPPAFVVRLYNSISRGRVWLTVALLWIASLILVAAVVVWFSRERQPGDAAEGLKRAFEQNTTLQQRVSVLERAEQVGRAANADLQRELGERQDEIAGLRADLTFYSRLTRVDAKREGLLVQALHLQSAAPTPRLYNFTLILTQNLKPGQPTSGHVKLSVGGLRDDKLVTLEWKDLAQNQEAAGLAFAFKYFQQVKGSLLLPEGFAPNTLRVDVDGGTEAGKSTRDFDWAQTLSDNGTDPVGKQK